MSQKKFNENLARWSRSHPREAVWLNYVDADHLKICKTGGQYNLRQSNDGTLFYYHSKKNPLLESQIRFKHLTLNGAKLIFHYGAGVGYDFEAAAPWLEQDPERRLVILEDDLSVIARLFETEKGSDLLLHPQASLYYFKDLQSAEMFNQLFWHYTQLPFAISVSSAYEKIKKERSQELVEKLKYEFSTKNELLDEYLNFGATFFHNFYANLLKLPDAQWGNAFFGKFKEVPAIICGAGPSLQKNISLLKTLKSKALIFAGSSALNALAAAEISPHFGVGIDPNPKQADRLNELKQRSFPYFYRNRLFPAALDAMQGPKLYVTGGGGYEISHWFEKRLGIAGDDIEEGHNVVNFSLELAHAMGCNPIVFVGMDLAYTGLRLYSPGVISKTNKVEKNTVEVEELEKGAFLRNTIEGTPVYTLWKWVAESEWISTFAKDHPDHILINATEGGIGFEGIPNQTLEDVIKKHLNKTVPLGSRINKVLETAQMPQVTSAKVKKEKDVLKESLARCLEYLSVLSDENSTLRKQVQKGQQPEQNLTAKASLAETELAEEEGFAAVLNVFNEVYSRVLDREINEMHGLMEPDKSLKMLELNERKYTFLFQAAQVNLQLLDHSI